MNKNKSQAVTNAVDKKRNVASINILAADISKHASTGEEPQAKREETRREYDAGSVQVHGHKRPNSGRDYDHHDVDISKNLSIGHNKSQMSKTANKHILETNKMINDVYKGEDIEDINAINQQIEDVGGGGDPNIESEEIDSEEEEKLVKGKQKVDSHTWQQKFVNIIDDSRREFSAERDTVQKKLNNSKSQIVDQSFQPQDRDPKAKKEIFSTSDTILHEFVEEVKNYKSIHEFVALRRLGIYARDKQTKKLNTKGDFETLHKIEVFSYLNKNLAFVIGELKEKVKTNQMDVININYNNVVADLKISSLNKNYQFTQLGQYVYYFGVSQREEAQTQNQNVIDSISIHRFDLKKLSIDQVYNESKETKERSFVNYDEKPDSPGDVVYVPDEKNKNNQKAKGLHLMRNVVDFRLIPKYENQDITEKDNFDKNDYVILSEIDPQKDKKKNKQFYFYSLRQANDMGKNKVQFKLQYPLSDLIFQQYVTRERNGIRSRNVTRIVVELKPEAIEKQRKSKRGKYIIDCEQFTIKKQKEIDYQELDTQAQQPILPKAEFKVKYIEQKYERGINTTEGEEEQKVEKKEKETWKQALGKIAPNKVTEKITYHFKNGIQDDNNCLSKIMSRSGDKGKDVQLNVLDDQTFHKVTVIPTILQHRKYIKCWEYIYEKDRSSEELTEFLAERDKTLVEEHADIDLEFNFDKSDMTIQFRDDPKSAITEKYIIYTEQPPDRAVFCAPKKIEQAGKNSRIKKVINQIQVFGKVKDSKISIIKEFKIFYELIGNFKRNLQVVLVGWKFIASTTDLLDAELMPLGSHSVKPPKQNQNASQIEDQIKEKLKFTLKKIQHYDNQEGSLTKDYSFNELKDLITDDDENKIVGSLLKIKHNKSSEEDKENENDDGDNSFHVSEDTFSSGNSQNKSSNYRIIFQNLEKEQYMFKSSYINSSWKYYNIDKHVKFLVINLELNLKDHKLQRIQQEPLLSPQRKIEEIFQQTLVKVLDMTPNSSKSQLEKWMERANLLNVDMFQLRQTLKGLSFASILSQEIQMFQDLQQVAKKDKLVTILNQFSQQTHQDIDEIFKMQDNFFIKRINQMLRSPNDVTVGLDFKSPIQHCLYKDEERLERSIKVIPLIIKQITLPTYNQQMTIQMLVPDILFHPNRKVAEQASSLFLDFKQDQPVASYFEEFTNTIGESHYFDDKQYICFIQNFESYYNQKYLEVADTSIPTERRDEFSLRVMREVYGIQEGGIHKGRIFKISSGMVNKVLGLRQLFSQKFDQLLYSYDQVVDQHQQGKIIDQILNLFHEDIEKRTNVIAMIDSKFNQHTRRFFIAQQIFYVSLFVVPFIILQTLERGSEYMITFLIVSMVGQLIFFFLEMINLYLEGWKKYFEEGSNNIDLIQSFLFFAYFTLKLIDHSDIETDKEIQEDEQDSVRDAILIIATFLAASMVGKFQHLIKIYPAYGRLTVLIYESIRKVIPFIIIFLLWNAMFALQYYILKSNTTDVEGYKGLNPSAGYIILAFENGIGNIVNPTVDQWINKNQGISTHLIIYMVYFVWFSNQFILLIVLLNFVISMISEVYTEVTEQKLRHQYLQRTQLNNEWDRFKYFYSAVRYFGSNKTDKMALVILVNAMKQQDDVVELQELKDQLKNIYKKQEEHDKKMEIQEQKLDRLLDVVEEFANRGADGSSYRSKGTLRMRD